MTSFHDWEDDQLDQAISAFTEGFGEKNLEALRAEVDGQELDELECTIAAIHWTQVAKVESVPQKLMQKLQDQAQAWVRESEEGEGAIHDFAFARGERQSPEVQPVGKGRIAWMAWAGWAAAALVLVFTQLSKPAPSQTTDQSLQNLLAEADDLLRLEWEQGEDPLAKGVEGEVLWSSSEQEGFMVFRGLAPNDPKQNQYQLWVFDTTRPDWEAQPVDGGVFDVLPGGEAVVAIDPKLSIQSPGLFAITLERPGGVVVSKRERLVLLAKPAS